MPLNKIHHRRIIFLYAQQIIAPQNSQNFDGIEQ